MNILCPFFKENCRGNECVMFRNEECLVVSFLQRVSEGVPALQESVPSSEAVMEGGGAIFRREVAEAPEWISKQTPEELAVEILEFKKKEFPEDEEVSFHTVLNFFWTSKGVDRFLLPSEAQIKIERANFLAQRETMKEAEARKKKRLQEEKEELPSLVSQCVDWARLNGLNRITVADADTYIMEKNIDILYETKRALYAMANVKLKSKK